MKTHLKKTQTRCVFVRFLLFLGSNVPSVEISEFQNSFFWGSVNNKNNKYNNNNNNNNYDNYNCTTNNNINIQIIQFSLSIPALTCKKFLKLCMLIVAALNKFTVVFCKAHVVRGNEWSISLSKP